MEGLRGLLGERLCRQPEVALRPVWGRRVHRRAANARRVCKVHREQRGRLEGRGRGHALWRLGDGDVYLTGGRGIGLEDLQVAPPCCRTCFHCGGLRDIRTCGRDICPSSVGRQGGSSMCGQSCVVLAASTMSASRLCCLTWPRASPSRASSCM